MFFPSYLNNKRTGLIIGVSSFIQGMFVFRNIEIVNKKQRFILKFENVFIHIPIFNLICGKKTSFIVRIKDVFLHKM